MPYEFDVFVSYRRHYEWPMWVREIFRPLFDHWLGEELGRAHNVFTDYEVESGVSWPQRLGQALGGSRVLVSLLSRQYFSSPWCQLEFAHMRAREVKCNLRTAHCPGGLIIPAHIHDGQDFPKFALEIQAAQLQQYTNVRLAKGGLTEEQLSSEIRKWMPDIVQAINSAPGYDPTWAELAVRDFVQQFAAPEPVQSVPPSLG
jgi:hypothetical protein